MSAVVTKVTSVPVLTIVTRFSVPAMITKLTNVPVATMISTIRKTAMATRTTRNFGRGSQLLICFGKGEPSRLFNVHMFQY